MIGGAAGGGVMGPRKRVAKKRLKQRRQFRGVVCGGDLVVSRGAWVTTIDRDGNPSNENVWDATLGLYVNLGDTLIVCGVDIVAAKIVSVAQCRGVEVWRLDPWVADGKVIVMKGPKT